MIFLSYGLGRFYLTEHSAAKFIKKTICRGHLHLSGVTWWWVGAVSHYSWRQDTVILYHVAVVLLGSIDAVLTPYIINIFLMWLLQKTQCDVLINLISQHLLPQLSVVNRVVLCSSPSIRVIVSIGSDGLSDYTDMFTVSHVTPCWRYGLIDTTKSNYIRPLVYVFVLDNNNYFGSKHTYTNILLFNI